jgi:hypothetical protein
MSAIMTALALSIVAVIFWGLEYISVHLIFKNTGLITPDDVLYSVQSLNIALPILLRFFVLITLASWIISFAKFREIEA